MRGGGLLLVDFEVFWGGADFLDLLVIIADGTDSNLCFLVLESDDASWSWGIWCAVASARKSHNG